MLANKTTVAALLVLACHRMNIFRLSLTKHLRWRHVIIASPLVLYVFFNSFLTYLTNTLYRTDRMSVDLYTSSSSSLLSTVTVLSTKSFTLSTLATSRPTVNRTAACEREQPCTYSDKVDLRIIVTAYNRATSLTTLLESLDTLELDGHSAVIEIWIDRHRKTGKVHQQTLKAASEFQWSRGLTRVHVHTEHVGIYGQWIDTWRPLDDTDNELALIVEDDLSVSIYAYRWVRAVFRAYSHRADFAGASLTSHQMHILSPRPKRRLQGPQNHTVMMYKCFGTWGFVPKALHWRLFQVIRLCACRL